MPFVTFTLLPAVDVADGRGTRAQPRLHGFPGGAEWIHLVDLDAAFGRGSNAELLAAVIGELDVKVGLAGGIRGDASLAGRASPPAARGSTSPPGRSTTPNGAHGRSPRTASRVAVSLDVHVIEDPSGSEQHRLAARGGTADGGDLWETVEHLNNDGCARYVVTDVSRDGTMGGPNVELYRAVTRATTAPVITSGGISSLRRPRRPGRSRRPGARTWKVRSSARHSTPADSPCPMRSTRCGGSPRPTRFVV